MTLGPKASRGLLLALCKGTQKQRISLFGDADSDLQKERHAGRGGAHAQDAQNISVQEKTKPALEREHFKPTLLANFCFLTFEKDLLELLAISTG